MKSKQEQAVNVKGTEVGDIMERLAGDAEESNEPSVFSQLLDNAKKCHNRKNKLWFNTGACIYKVKLLHSIPSDSQEALKEAKATFFGILTDKLDGEVPDAGLDRKGKNITLRKKDGSIKWSAWGATSQLATYAISILRAIQQEGIESIFIDGVVIPRTQVESLLKAKKGSETPVDTIRRCADMIEKKLLQLDTVEEMNRVSDIMSLLLQAHQESVKAFDMRAEEETVVYEEVALNITGRC